MEELGVVFDLTELVYASSSTRRRSCKLDATRTAVGFNSIGDSSFILTLLWLRFSFCCVYREVGVFEAAIADFNIWVGCGQRLILKTHLSGGTVAVTSGDADAGLTVEVTGS